MYLFTYFLVPVICVCLVVYLIMNLPVQCTDRTHNSVCLRGHLSTYPCFFLQSINRSIFPIYLSLSLSLFLSSPKKDRSSSEVESIGLAIAARPEASDFFSYVRASGVRWSGVWGISGFGCCAGLGFFWEVLVDALMIWG